MVKAGDKEFLIAKVNGKYYATAGHCNHYGAPLDKGAMHDHRVVCPWHHAAFDVRTGNHEEPPAIDSIPTLELDIEGSEIYINVPDDYQDFREPDMKVPDKVDEELTVVILGAGAAGNAAAQTLREDGFPGRIIMITREERLPYDRPNLSKEYLSGEAPAEWMPLRDDDFFEKNKIDFRRGLNVKKIDPAGHMVSFDDGSWQSFHRLIIATGSEPIELDLPGSDLGHIETLRTFDDCDRIIAELREDSKVAIIGASFIGMETAHSLTQRDIPVTVIAPDTTPFEFVLGKEVGNIFLDEHKKRSVDFRLGRKPASFKGENGVVNKVLLDNGDEIEADLVIMGIGVKPNVSDLTRELDLSNDGGVIVDQYLRATDEIYAAGDVAAYKDFRTGRLTRIEHWRHAHQQGIVAAHNIAGFNIPYKRVPFFWTSQAGLELKYVGHAENWDETIIDGDIENREFVIYYVENGVVTGAAAMNRDRDIAAVEELMRVGKMPTAERITDEPIIDLLKE
jgi:NADPH-dependent 2,4-dienoyl-CoA reductase/sulfur reductase-like enzyme/nitrite reductase/ring-hydroxylating ferredoxin subunit